MLKKCTGKICTSAKRCQSKRFVWALALSLFDSIRILSLNLLNRSAENWTRILFAYAISIDKKECDYIKIVNDARMHRAAAMPNKMLKMQTKWNIRRREWKRLRWNKKGTSLEIINFLIEYFYFYLATCAQKLRQSDVKWEWRASRARA